MCGILGEINFYKEINVNTISSASNLINHRGPDSEGSYVSKIFVSSINVYQLLINQLKEIIQFSILIKMFHVLSTV